MNWKIMRSLAVVLIVHCGANELFAQKILILRPPIGSSWVGRSLVAVNDLDGDTGGEVVVDAPSDHLPGDPRLGRAYVFSGTTGALLHALGTPERREISESFGAVVGRLSDLDADGIDEIAVSAHTAQGVSGAIAAGAVYVFSGRTGELFRVLRSTHEAFGGNFGISGAVDLGDVNADGLAEAGVGATFDSQVGRAYIYDVVANAPLIDFSVKTSAHFGARIGAAGDMTSDGVPDILVVASRETAESGDHIRGVTYLFSGATGEMVYRIPGVKGDVESIQDLDADGVRDFVIGSGEASPPGVEPFDGCAYVFSGATGKLIRRILGPSPQESSDFGVSIAVMDDTDADGVADIAIGDRHARVGDNPQASGAVYIHSGATGELLRRIVSPSPIRNGLFGEGIAAVPDANGDGRMDLAINATFEISIDGERHVYVFMSCAADFDGSGIVNSADFFLFLQRFFADAPAADFNRDRSIDSRDFFDYLAAFFAGC